MRSGGSDWRKIELLQVDPATGSGTKMDDTLDYVKFSSIAWTHDHKVCIPRCLSHSCIGVVCLSSKDLII